MSAWDKSSAAIMINLQGRCLLRSLVIYPVIAFKSTIEICVVLKPCSCVPSGKYSFRDRSKRVYKILGTGEGERNQAV